MPPRPPNTASIRLLMAMADHGWLLFDSDHGGHFVDPKTGQRAGKTAEYKDLFSRQKGRMYEYLTEVPFETSKVTAQRAKSPSYDSLRKAWYEKVYEINQAGRDLVEANRARIEKAVKAQAEKDKASERLVIFRKWDRRTDGGFGRVPQFDGLFRVTRETEKSLYGEIVLPVVRKDDWNTDAFWLIRDVRNKPHIERSQVVIDNATKDLYLRLKKIEQERFADMNALHDQMVREQNEIARRYQERLKQSDAMYDDMFREAGLDEEARKALAQTNKFRDIEDPEED